MSVILDHCCFVLGPDGEHHWSRNYPYCGGAFQSPINFQPELLRYDPDLLPVQLQDYNLSSKEQLTLSNSGHSSTGVSICNEIFLEKLNLIK